MTTMKSVPTGGPGKIEVAEIERPVPGPRDLLVRTRACGSCGTDATFVQMGGMPRGPDGHRAPSGHRKIPGQIPAKLPAGLAPPNILAMRQAGPDVHGRSTRAQVLNSDRREWFPRPGDLRRSD